MREVPGKFPSFSGAPGPVLSDLHAFTCGTSLAFPLALWWEVCISPIRQKRKPRTREVELLVQSLSAQPGQSCWGWSPVVRPGGPTATTSLQGLSGKWG